MDLSYATYRLKCVHPFTISRSSYSHYDRVFIYVEQDDLIGRGEAAPSERYGESINKILDILAIKLDLPIAGNDPSEMLPIINNYSKGVNSLRSAIVSAIWDWHAQSKKLKLTEYLNISDKINNPTSFTIAISDLDKLEKKIVETEPYKILKVKLGTKNDKEIIRTIRKYTDKPIRVDANEGWSLETAKIMCRWLVDKKVELIEQPLPADQIDEMTELLMVSPIPLFADENCMNSSDIIKLIGKFNGINIKLSKCGGIDEALCMIKIAKENDLKIMLGCMVESSLGITAVGQIASQADYLDLDGNLLVENDPYSGLIINNGIPILPRRNGLGTELKSDNTNYNLELK